MKVIFGLITFLFVLSTATANLNAQEKEEEQQSNHKWRFEGLVLTEAFSEALK